MSGRRAVRAELEARARWIVDVPAAYYLSGAGRYFVALAGLAPKGSVLVPRRVRRQIVSVADWRAGYRAPGVRR